MARYRLTPAAEADLEGIWLYTLQEWSPAQADAYLNDIFDRIEALADGSQPGRPVDIRDGYVKAASGRHMIYARPTESGVDVIRILHQAMDVDRHL